MYLYSPQSIPTVICQLSIFRTDRTRPVGGNGRIEKQRCWVTRRAGESDQGWPDASDHSKPFLEPLCTLTGRTDEYDRWWPDVFGQRSSSLEMDRTTVDASDQFPSRVRSRHLPSLTLVNMIYASGPWEDRVRSIVLSQRWLPVLTGRVRSR
jgi:hypothetical protein